MATITLAANTTYSALTIADDDVIDLAGYLLTVNGQPGETGISITSPGTAGTVTLSGGYDLSTWSMTAGTGVLIAIIPSGTELGSLTGGSATSAYGCSTNNGTITTCTGGSGGTNASGCNTNRGTITTCTGGSATTAQGCYGNQGLITTAVGGTGTSAFGITHSYGYVLNLTDSAVRAVGNWNSPAVFVFGPGVVGEIKAPVTTIYSLGAMNAGATLPVGSSVITLSVCG
jgi:hypothetical protein